MSSSISPWIIVSTFSALATTQAFAPNQNSHFGIYNSQTSTTCSYTTSTAAPTTTTTTTSLRTSIFDDFEEFESTSSSSAPLSNDDSSNQADLFASLRARQDFLDNGIFASSGTASTYNTNTGTGSTSSSSSSSTSSTTNNNNDKRILESSGRRKTRREEEIISNWKNAECSSSVRLSLNDWIRRVAVDTFPLAVCGSAKGNIYLADLEKGEELDCITSVHEAFIDDDVVADAMKRLYGLYDGSGVIAVGIRNDIVVSAGREGGVHVFKIDGEEESYYKGSRGGSSKSTKLHLESQGKIRDLESTLVTSVEFDNDGMLWAGCYDGYIRAFEYDDRDVPLVEQKEPAFEIDVGAEVLSLSINNDIGCGVAATTETVVLFSLEEGEVLAQWKAFGKGVGKRKREYPRSAIIVQNDEQSRTSTGERQDAVWSIICGGSEGSMYQRRLNVDSLGYVSDRKPFIDDETLRGRLRPGHASLVMALASPSPGLLISGSQDGTIRMWDCSYYRNNDDEGDLLQDEEDDEAYYDDIGNADRRPKCLYAMKGFKVWLGSIFTDGELFVTDGADNNVYVHDFSGDDDNAEGFLYGDDDLEDDLEDFSFD